MLDEGRLMDFKIYKKLEIIFIFNGLWVFFHTNSTIVDN